MEYCVGHLFMCANADENVSSSMSHAVAGVRDGVPSNPGQVAKRSQACLLRWSRRSDDGWSERRRRAGNG